MLFAIAVRIVVAMIALSGILPATNMDSITQAALGAAVAEAGMGGKRLGNKAILWGIGLGTLPDLDIVFFPWMDAVQQLEWHRGISHSLVFVICAAPLIGWIIARIHRGKISVARAAWTTFAILFTHVLIDVFTVYGTMVFEPFSDFRLGFNNFFIIDPLYTIPLLVGLGIALFSRPDARRRRVANFAGLALSSIYVIWSFGAKAVADRQFVAAMDEQGLVYSKRMTAPTPLNTILWRGLARTDDGVYVGYFSLLDPKRPITFDFIPRNEHLVADIADTRAVRRLRWFSDEYWTARVIDGTPEISDWRFGEIRASFDPLDLENQASPIFAWRLVHDGNEFMPVIVRPQSGRRAMLGVLWDRIIGRDRESGDRSSTEAVDG